MDDAKVTRYLRYVANFEDTAVVLAWISGMGGRFFLCSMKVCLQGA